MRSRAGRHRVKHPAEPVAGRRTVLRVAAAVGAVLAAWVAVDVFRHGVASSARGGFTFFLFWGLPFAAAATYLSWFAALGARPAVRTIARSGCLGALLGGGLAFVALWASPLVADRDILRAAIDALRYSPFAAALGLAIGLAAGVVRRSGP